MKMNIKQSLLDLTMIQKKLWIVIILIALTVFFVSFKLIAKTSTPTKTPVIPEQRIVHETDLNTVYLTGDSRQKLGIQTAAI